MLNLNRIHTFVFRKLLCQVTGRSRSFGDVCDEWSVPILKTQTAAWDKNWDLQGDTGTCGTRVILLINHGEFSNGNLTEKGFHQILSVANRLNYLRYRIQKLTHTGSDKTSRSADVLLANLVEGNIALRECPLLKEAEKVALNAPVSNAVSADLLFRNEVIVEAAFRKHFYRSKPGSIRGIEIFVSYPNIINYFVCRCLQLSTRAWVRLSPPHGSITVLSYDGKSASMDSFGEIGHLSPGLITESE